jgi:hypothetical protein
VNFESLQPHAGQRAILSHALSVPARRDLGRTGRALAYVDGVSVYYARLRERHTRCNLLFRSVNRKVVGLITRQGREEGAIPILVPQ